MKKEILILFLFFLPIEVFSQPSPPVLNDLENCTVSEFLSHFQTKEIAIDSLVQVTLSDTIDDRMVWYHESATGIPWELRAYRQTDRYVASVKFKAYYWMLCICQGRINDVSDDSVAIFLGKDGEKVFDYEMLNYKQYAKDIEKVRQGKRKYFWIPVYISTHDNGVASLQTQILNWNQELKRKGLDHLLRNNIFPFERGQYRMVKRITFEDLKK